MKRWLLIAAAAILTLGGLAVFNAPAMAREYHPPYVHASAPGYPVTWRRNATPHNATIRRAAQVRATHAREAQFRPSRHAAYRR
jgi:hypothetical protein